MTHEIRLPKSVVEMLTPYVNEFERAGFKVEKDGIRFVPGENRKLVQLASQDEFAVFDVVIPKDAAEGLKTIPHVFVTCYSHDGPLVSASVHVPTKVNEWKVKCPYCGREISCKNTFKEVHPNECECGAKILSVEVGDASDMYEAMVDFADTFLDVKEEGDTLKSTDGRFAAVVVDRDEEGFLHTWVLFRKT